MNKKQFVCDLEEMLELPPDTIKAEDNLDQVPNWDSMAVVSFIAMADARYGRSVAATRLRSCRSVDDLFALIS